MGCFFGCLRVKDNPNARLFAGTVPSKNRDHLVSRNRLATLLSASDEHDAGASPVPSKGKNSPNGNFLHINPQSNSGVHEDEDDDDKELKKEVKFLKSCGTLLNTPAELRKASKLVKKSTIDEQDASFEDYSCSTAPSCAEVQLKKQDLVCTSPLNVYEEPKRSHPCENPSYLTNIAARPEEQKKNGDVGCLSADDSLQQPKDVFVSSEVLITDSKNSADTLLSNSFRHPVEAVHSKKFVHFECSGKEPSDLLKRKFCVALIEDKDGQQGQKMSPYPTPLKLTDEMQTPGTVYTYQRNCVNSKNSWIRQQCVHPVTRPIENSTRWKALNSDLGGLVGHPEEFPLKDIIDGPEMEPSSYWNSVVLESCGSSDDALCGKDSEKTISVDSSLTDWLKPAYPKDVPCRKATTNSNGSKNSDIDRPIIGMVAAHWNDEQMSVSPKCWDGNGIPNSTSKYKEDQKVSWHATPFEERLEKALSDEKFYPQRGHLFGLDENECDTAASRC